MESQEPAGTPRSGVRAVLGAAMAVVGALAAANPQNVLLKVINDTVPQLATAVPAVITAIGATVAAFSHPPRLGG